MPFFQPNGEYLNPYQFQILRKPTTQPHEMENILPGAFQVLMSYSIPVEACRLHNLAKSGPQDQDMIRIFPPRTCGCEGNLPTIDLNMNHQSQHLSSRHHRC
ncbi:hypothetical protein QC760_000775 [Botrytis cinerea]